MTTDLKIKTGTVGLILAAVGTIGRIVFVVTRQGGIHPIEVASQLSPLQVALGGGSALLILVGGFLGLFGAIKGEGRGLGLLAAAVAVLVFILMFTKGCI